MTKIFLKDGFIWGFALWFIGYVLGIALFFVVPQSMLGWIIMPIGIIIALWVLFKRVKADSAGYYLKLGLLWMVIAVVCDFLFLVRLFQPEDGYYKADVYLYYILTFTLPLLVWWYKDLGKLNHEKE